MKNQTIRLAAKNANVWLWEIADRLGLNDGSFSRKLRKELPQEETEKILLIIREIQAEHAKGGT